MALHTAMIGGVEVPGFRYVVYGPKRGYVSTHRTKAAAFRSWAEAARARMRAGGPSDAEVYRWPDGGWELVGPEVTVELADPSELRPTRWRWPSRFSGPTHAEARYFFSAGSNPALSRSL